MNTENTDKNNTFSRGFSRMGMDLLQTYCHPEFIEGGSFGEKIVLPRSHFNGVQCDNIYGKKYLRVLRGKNIICVHSRPSLAGFTILSGKKIRGVINV